MVYSHGVSLNKQLLVQNNGAGNESSLVT